jgi:hypothetical protein
MITRWFIEVDGVRWSRSSQRQRTTSFATYFAIFFITIHSVEACNDGMPLSMNLSLVAPPFVHMAASTYNKVMVTSTPKAGATFAVQIVLEINGTWDLAREHASGVPGLNMNWPWEHYIHHPP